MNAARTTPNNRPENNTPAGDATRADQDAADPRHMAKAAATVLHSTGTSIGEGVGASIAKTASTRANAIRDLNDAFRAGRACSSPWCRYGPSACPDR